MRKTPCSGDKHGVLQSRPGLAGRHHSSRSFNAPITRSFRVDPRALNSCTARALTRRNIRSAAALCGYDRSRATRTVLRDRLAVSRPVRPAHGREQGFRPLHFEPDRPHDVAWRATQAAAVECRHRCLSAAARASECMIDLIEPVVNDSSAPQFAIAIRALRTKGSRIVNKQKAPEGAQCFRRLQSSVRHRHSPTV